MADQTYHPRVSHPEPVQIIGGVAVPIQIATFPSPYFSVKLAVLAESLDTGDLIPGEPVDGAMVKPGDRILRFGITGVDGAGIYVVGNPGEAATRATDANTLEELIASPYVLVLEGRNYRMCRFVIETDGDLDLGVAIRLM